MCTRIGARSVQCSPSPVTNGASQAEGSPRPLLGTPWSLAALCPRLWGCQRGVWGSHRQAGAGGEKGGRFGGWGWGLGEELGRQV